MESNVMNDLSCTNITDRFSVSNNKAQLTYKVGLMSNSELNLLNDYHIRKTGQKYWLISLYYFYTTSYGRTVGLESSFGNYAVNVSTGVRPAVSLNSSTEYFDGDGSRANPYVIEVN